MGFKGAKPFCESLSTFFSEESRGPSRPERQVKRDLRGKSQAEKGEKTRGKSRAHKAHGRQTASRPRQRRPDTKAAGCPQAGGKTAAHRRKKPPGHRARKPHNSDRRCKNGHPGRRRGALDAEKPLRTGKIRVRSFACPEGPCEQGPPKIRFAVFGWHGLFLLRIANNAARSTEQKGAPPPFIPCKLFEKSLTKNFTVLAV